jgi:putative hydrolase of the HAD superfamily
MKRPTKITTLFLDIGGVLLTDGWDHHARKRAAANFKLEWAEVEGRHRLNFDIYEEGKLTLEEYLGRVVFYQKRPFTRAEFRHFMFDQSKPYPDMIALIAQLKVRHGLKIVVVSNEARELPHSKVQAGSIGGFVCFLLLRPPSQARRGHLSARAGHRPDPSPEGALYRRHLDVCSARRRFGDSKHSAHELQVYARRTGFVRIEE